MLLKVEKVWKHFGEFPALKGVSFEVKKGEVVGLLGPNGAGKTTMMRILTGFYQPSQGKVTLDGVSVVENREYIQERVGYLPENNPLYLDMLVEEYLNFLADVRNLQGSLRKERLEYAISATGIEKYYYTPISHLSKGYRQRVGLAGALLHDPEILILDEPTSGLDPNQILEIQGLIKKLGEEKTIFLSTHILEEVRKTCKRAIIIREGEIVYDDTLEHLEKLSEGSQKIYLTLKGDIPQAKEILQKAFPNESIEETERNAQETRLLITTPKDLSEEIFQVVVKNQWILRELYRERISLVEIFRKLTLDAS